MRTPVPPLALAVLALLSPALPAAAQTFPGAASAADYGAALRLENEARWNAGQLRALEAELGRLRTDQTLRELQARRLPDPRVASRQADLDATQAENLARAAQAASTANAARLRAADPAYDRRLRDLGYASSLPLTPRR